MYNNYKRISFILGLVILALISTDSNIEKLMQRSLLSLLNIGVAEGSELGSTAPTSLLNIFENMRLGIINYIFEGVNSMQNLQLNSEGIISNLYYVGMLFLSLLKFLASYIFIFYPLLIVLLYFIFTSRLFRNKYDYR